MVCLPILASTEYARTSGIQLDTTSPNQSSPYIVDRTIQTIREMTHAYLFTSNLSLIWWYAATKCAIYVINRLPRPPRKSPIETFSGKPWDMSKLQPFGCMCSFHVPKLMRGISAALWPTSKAGIFIGYSLTFHKYVVFVISSGSIVERSRVYFNSDVFLDDLGCTIVTTIGTTTHDVAAPTCLHVGKSPMITRPAETPDLQKVKVRLVDSSQCTASVNI